MAEREPEKKGSLFGLLGRIPELVGRLIREEIATAKAEISAKAKAAGMGAGVVVGGALFAILALQTLIAAAVLGLSNVLQPWLAALLIGVALLVLAGIAILVGLKMLKRGVPPVPEQAVESVKADIRTVKGTER